MCRGLAVIAYESPSGWIVEAREGVSSHDALLHQLNEELRFGNQKHLKFEVLFPRSIACDVMNRLRDYYPEDWIVTQWGKRRACDAAYAAVETYLLHRPALLTFGPHMLQSANLSEADLFKANLSEADLFKANLSEANLSEANLFKANLFEANLIKANLFEAIMPDGKLYNGAWPRKKEGAP